MIKDIWSTPEFQRRSKSARNNWLTETNDKLSTHSGSIVSFTSYRASMIIYIFLFVTMDFKILCLYFLIFFFVDSKKKTGEKEPLWDDVFSVLHQSAKQPETFIDNKSKKVVVSIFYII